MKAKILYALLLLLSVIALSCRFDPEPIRIGKDACAYCKMGVSDNRFGAEIITKKGKIYKFDDLHCLIGMVKDSGVNRQDIKAMYSVDFEEPHQLIDLQNAFLLKSELLKSPMGSNVAAFNSEQQLHAANRSIKGEPIKWDSLLP